MIKVKQYKRSVAILLLSLLMTVASIIYFPQPALSWVYVGVIWVLFILSFLIDLSKQRGRVT
jgi:hypothetical protein